MHPPARPCLACLCIHRLSRRVPRPSVPRFCALAAALGPSTCKIRAENCCAPSPSRPLLAHKREGKPGRRQGAKLFAVCKPIHTRPGTGGREGKQEGMHSASLASDPQHIGRSVVSTGSTMCVMYMPMLCWRPRLADSATARTDHRSKQQIRCQSWRRS